jgi:hypothetical protein
MKRRLVPGLILLACALSAQSPTLINRNAQWPPYSGSAFSYGGPFEFVSQSLPTTPTVVTPKTAHIIGIWLHNPSGITINFTIKDQQGTPQPLPLDGQAITSPNDVAFSAPFGVLAYGGITVSASAPGLIYQIVFTN